jgi:hypothetical protein
LHITPPSSHIMGISSEIRSETSRGALRPVHQVLYARVIRLASQHDTPPTHSAEAPQTLLAKMPFGTRTLNDGRKIPEVRSHTLSFLPTDELLMEDLVVLTIVSFQSLADRIWDLEDPSRCLQGPSQPERRDRVRPYRYRSSVSYPSGDENT